MLCVTLGLVRELALWAWRLNPKQQVPERSLMPGLFGASFAGEMKTLRGFCPIAYDLVLPFSGTWPQKAYLGFTSVLCKMRAFALLQCSSKLSTTQLLEKPAELL